MKYKSVILIILIFTEIFCLSGYSAETELFSAETGFFSAVSTVKDSVQADNHDLKIIINFQEYTFVPSPFIKENRILVPLRSVSESLDCYVSWDETDRKASIYYEDNTVILFADKKTTFVNGVETIMDTIPEMREDRLFVPLRFIAEALDSSVDWDPEENIVTIENSNAVEFPSPLPTSNIFNPNSQRNPGQLKEEFKVSYQNTTGEYSYNISMTELLYDEKALNRLKNFEPDFQSAEEGFEYILAKFKITVFEAGKVDFISKSDLQLTTVSQYGTLYNFKPEVSGLTPIFPLDVKKNDVHEGWKLFLVAKEDIASAVINYGKQGQIWFDLRSGAPIIQKSKPSKVVPSTIIYYDEFKDIPSINSVVLSEPININIIEPGKKAAYFYSREDVWDSHIGSYGELLLKNGFSQTPVSGNDMLKYSRPGQSVSIVTSEDVCMIGITVDEE